VESIYHAVEGGLFLPIVYNTSSYDSLRSLELLGKLLLRTEDTRAADLDPDPPGSETFPFRDPDPDLLLLKTGIQIRN